MLPRLSRARVPLTRCLQTQSVRPPSNTTKYAIAVGTVATIAFFSTQWNPLPTIALDSAHPRSSSSSLDPPRPSPASKSTLGNKKSTEDTTPDDALNLKPGQPEPEPNPVPSDSEPERDAGPAQTDGDVADADASRGDSGGGAFNPETGEINWDCPCLGGMAHGPCGPEFREAFSCFVHSEDEPKGINCVEKFQGMQTCFREHPDVYASEIADDEEAENADREAAKDNEQQRSRTDVAGSESVPGADNEGTSPTHISDSESVSPSAPKPKSSEGVPSSQE
ncbi:hypothetical protein DFH07DRAFT_805883 [Mycena maculata]|uniref:Mitochondrial intermembrane space import and assembly protein 40 n=1 Tax=Mycena maculata TaxID=230809 RepID=A0AAD7NQG7_9AGAR|nr:hypothetical protein DFH07DRAFT_805883 [Mycena maculata]